jgi:outer membrane protein OmpA-like peptidoglycan-associated protein
VLSQDQSATPLDSAMVYAYDEKTGALLDSALTDKTGRYDLSLPFDHDYKIVVKKEGYDLLDDKLKFTTHGRPMGVDTLDIALWKRELFASGQIYSNETHLPLTGVTVTVFDLKDSTEQSYRLDSISKYMVPIKPNRKYRIEFNKIGYIKTGLDLNTDRQMRGVILNDIVIEEEYLENAIIRFEYNKSTMTEESIEQLKPIVMALRKLPTATVFIGAHADSRGSSAYNQMLSEKRAKFAVNYFLSKGISAKRLTARGFGESLLLNRCSDVETCEEVEHSVNRRVEVKLQKAVQK